MCILIINAKIWTTYLLFVKQCMHLVYQEIHLKPFLYMWTIKRSKNRKHRCFSLRMIFSCTANRKLELCIYTGYSHYLFSSPGFYGTTVVNVLPEIKKKTVIYPSENIICITSADPFLHIQCIIFNQSMFTSL